MTIFRGTISTDWSENSETNESAESQMMIDQKLYCLKTLTPFRDDAQEGLLEKGNCYFGSGSQLIATNSLRENGSVRRGE
jgi:hypothetical protein